LLPRVFCDNVADQEVQGDEFPVLHQVELQDAEDEVLKARIKVTHSPRLFHVLRVHKVDVSINPKQTREDLGHRHLKRTREGDVCRWRENRRIMQLLFHP
jgi:hypothetical protein